MEGKCNPALTWTEARARAISYNCIRCLLSSPFIIVEATQISLLLFSCLSIFIRPKDEAIRVLAFPAVSRCNANGSFFCAARTPPAS